MTPDLKPAGPDDGELLYLVYASTREEELAVVPWDGPTKEAFLRMQFAAQDSYYRANWPNASYDLIVSGNEALGRLYVDRDAETWQVLDIALLPQYRGMGVGTQLLGDILTEATEVAKPVQIYVERFNPARHLYDRLGFKQIGEQEIYLLMEREPGYPNTAS